MRILFLLAAILLAGCSTVAYKVNPAAPPNYTIESSRNFMIRAARDTFLGTYGCGDKYQNTVWLTSDRLIASCFFHEGASGTVERTFRFADIPEIDGTYTVGPQPFKNCIRFSSHTDCSFALIDKDGTEWVPMFVNAWYMLAKNSKPDPNEEIKFAAEAQMYLSAKDKPTIPEEVVRLKVQADLAVKEKRPADAANLYHQALTISPWWSAGHFNVAMINTEIRDYSRAILAFRRYLKLEPQAPNARAIQNRIYELEALAAK